MPLATSKGTGVLSFNTNPPGATIFIDGEEYTVNTPASVNSIPIGDHTYTLRKDGFLDYTNSTTVGDTQLCCVNIDMKTSKETGKCSIEPVPSYEGLVPTVPTRPDYGILIVGLFAGMLIVKLIEKKS